MTDDDLKAAFRSLDRVQPSTDFLQSVRSIPLRYPRGASDFSLWRLFGLPSRLVALGMSAVCGLGVGYLTLDDDAGDAELSAFLELGEDTALSDSALNESALDDDTAAGGADAEWDSL